MLISSLFRPALTAGLLVTLCTGTLPAQSETSNQEGPKPVPATRPAEKEALERLKERTPRLPLEGEPGVGVSNGRSRKQYLPAAWTAADFRDDPTMTLDPTFKVKLFWIVSRANNCHYCLGHQEVKLTAANVSEDEIARLDFDWSEFDPAAQAAFVFTRAVTLDPASVTDQMLADLRAHYSDLQIVEMVHTVAMFNGVNRWTDAMGLPQDDRMRDHEVRFDAPTSTQYSSLTSTVAPLDRGPVGTLVDADLVIKQLTQATQRTSMIEALLQESSASDVPEWERACLLFPTAGAQVIEARRSMFGGEEIDGELAAVIARTTARRNQAWYALGHAESRLAELGWNAEARSTLDDPSRIDRADLASVIRFAHRLSARPERIEDADIQELQRHFDNTTVARIIFVVAASNQFDRFTESLRLRLESLPADQVSSLDPSEAVAKLSAEAATAWEQLKDLPTDSEAGLMRDSILQGSRLGPDEGWFKAAKNQTRYSWSVIAGRFDTNGDGEMSREEFPGSDVDFVRLDRNLDQRVTEADVTWPTEDEGNAFWSLLRQLDRDGDGRITLHEIDAFRDRLVEQDRSAAELSSGELKLESVPFVSIEGLRRALVPPPRVSTGPPADAPSVNTLMVALASEEIGALTTGPALEESVPNFSAQTLEGQTFDLAEGLSERPTVVVLGNFTCGPFRSEAGNLQRLKERYGDRVRFVMIYVREAHPTGGWWMERNQRQGVEVAQPTTAEERRDVAERCAAHLGFEIPIIVDGIDDELGQAFSGMPARLYLIDREGKVAFKSGRGPFGFETALLETAVIFESLAE